VILIKSEEEIKRVAEACAIVAEALSKVGDLVGEGITTRELERAAEDAIERRGGAPAFKGYKGFPASICTSVNNVVVHGMPSPGARINEGDILSIDLGVYYKGFYGDAAVTIPVGSVSEEALKLLSVTEEALYIGIEKATVGNRVSDISNAVQAHVEGNGFSVVRAFVGHGIGKSLHEEPQVPNYGPPGRGPRLKEGMTLAIEPMVNSGGFDVKVLDDGWTAVTVDGSLSAHFEHTVAVTDGEVPRVLTKL
jgi:methionyl aminopeptidase